MALSTYEIINLNKILKQNIDNIYFYDLIEVTKSRNVNGLYEYFVNNLTKCLNGPFNDKKILKMIHCLKKILVNAKDELDKNLTRPNYGFRKLYSDYLKRNNVEKNEEIETELDNYINLVTSSFVFDSEGKPTVVEEIEKEPEQEQEETIDDLRKELEATKEIILEYSNLIKEYEQKIKKQNSNLESTRKDVKSKTKRIQQLEKSISEIKIEKKATQRENETEKYKQELIDVKNKISKLTKENSCLQKEKIKQEAKIKNYNSSNLEKIKIETLTKIIKEILLTSTKPYTLDEIYEKVKQSKSLATKEECFQILNELRNIFDFKDNVQRIPQTYYLANKMSPIYNNYHLVLDTPKKSFDMLFISDLHFKRFGKKELLELEKLYRYAEINNINLIIDLGDFIHDTSSVLKNEFSLLEQIIAKFPKSDSIHYGLMGGNHDEHIMEKGLNVIKYITANRSDFINLGYNHAFIDFPSSNTSLAIHHPCKKYNITSYGEETDNYVVDSVVSALNDYYGDLEINRDKIWLDFFGHFHKSSINMSNQICAVPSYLHDRQSNGAWHVTIYFDENKKTDYMLLKLLSVNTSLNPVDELIYQKSKKYK